MGTRGDQASCTSAKLGLPWVQIWTIVTAVILLAAFWLFNRHSRYGLAMRAAASDPEAALSVGISLRRVHAVAWGLAGLVACVGGVFLGGYPNSVSPQISDVALLAFPAIILGGIDSTTGAVTGGFIIGIVQELTAGYQPHIRELARPELLPGRSVRRDDHRLARPSLRPVRISSSGATMSRVLTFADNLAGPHQPASPPSSSASCCRSGWARTGCPRWSGS